MTEHSPATPTDGDTQSQDKTQEHTDADLVNAYASRALMRLFADPLTRYRLQGNFCRSAFAHFQDEIVWPADALKTIKACAPRKTKSSTDDPGAGTSGEVNDTKASPGKFHSVNRLLAKASWGIDRVFDRRGAWLEQVIGDSAAVLEGKLQGQLPRAMRSLEELGPLLGLSALDTRIAQNFWLIQESPTLNGVIYHLEGPAYRPLSVICACSRYELENTLEPDGALYRSGLMLMPGDLPRHLIAKGLPTFSHRTLKLLRCDATSPDWVLTRLLDPSPAPRLQAADFAHLTADAEALACLLHGAAQRGDRGVNVLIYGPPGTGKTEFARWLLAASGLRSYEVPVEDIDADGSRTTERAERQNTIKNAHHLLAAQRDVALIFDEAEDVFQKSGFGSPRLNGQKAWLNTLLESAPIPTLWISNAVRHIDPAFLRRFSFHLKMRQPPHSVRQRIALTHASQLKLPTEVALPLASYGDASPAMIDSALRFAQQASPAGATAASQAKLALHSLRAGLAVADLDDRPAAVMPVMAFEPAFIHTREPLALNSLLAGLRRTGQASLCLHGVPGTGKTSLARHLADQLDRPLLFKRGSDLQSPWLGVTEKNIKAMFREAAEDGAVLLLDEADSFLYDRSTAVRSWERGHVNELLQGMEAFEGIFVAATNLFGALDRAALRRFTFKLEFLPLTLAQRTALVLRELAHAMDAAERQALANGAAALHGLTPGDVAVVVKRGRLMDQRFPADEALALLRAELHARGDDRGTPMGFVQLA